MTLYEVLLFFHILAMAVWVGGTIMLAFISGKVERSRDVQLRARFAENAGVAGVVIGVSALIVLGSGIGMVLDSPAIELSQTWVWVALVLFGVSAVIGATYFGPATGKIVAALDAGQVEDADRRSKQFDLVARLDLLLLLVILGLMVFKPGAPF
jgi:uncharacterized membrane protein